MSESKKRGKPSYAELSAQKKALEEKIESLESEGAGGDEALKTRVIDLQGSLIESQKEVERLKSELELLKQNTENDIRSTEGLRHAAQQSLQLVDDYVSDCCRHKAGRRHCQSPEHVQYCGELLKVVAPLRFIINPEEHLKIMQRIQIVPEGERTQHNKQKRIAENHLFRKIMG